MKDFNNCLIVYIEIDVTDNIDSKAIISYNDFKIWKLVNEILILYLFALFFFLEILIDLIFLMTSLKKKKNLKLPLFTSLTF